MNPLSTITERPEWVGSLDREGAEKLLEKEPPGTYLLRNGDDYTRTIEHAMEKQSPIHCYLLTIAEEYGKVSDKLLVQSGDRWAIYNDDFELSNYSFQGLMETIREAGGFRPLRVRRKAA